MKRSEKRSLCLPCVTSKRFKLNKVEDDSVENIPFWGPYLAERHWGTVREDLSVDGDCWDFFPHDAARSRAYRSGEDGLLGVCDRLGLMCTALALWNGQDAILKERMFGLTNREGNHGEDVKELYYYLDSNPQYSYLKALYKYPHNAFPYQHLIDENARRTCNDPEFEILDTGVFQNNEYFDVYVEYAQTEESHLFCRVTAINQSSQNKSLFVVPQVWFRNTWSFEGMSSAIKPSLKLMGDRVIAEYKEGRFSMQFCDDPVKPNVLFTENETRPKSGGNGFYKDAFHKYIINGEKGAVNAECVGTKCCSVYNLTIPGGAERRVCWSIVPDSPDTKHFDAYQIDHIFRRQLMKTNTFFSQLLPHSWNNEEQNIARQTIAGLLWSKQFYKYNVSATVSEIELVRKLSSADTSQSGEIRNSQWPDLENCDVISMPDKWEFPWYAAWDLAFHMVPFLRFDPMFVKYQLCTLLQPRYMKSDGRLPGCEFDLDDPNPPLHAWACLQAFYVENGRDLPFLRFCFQRLLLNFKWWTSFSDHNNQQRHCGFLGMDNISVLNRSEVPPEGCRLIQADASGWMAFYAVHMLKIYLVVAAAEESPKFDMAEKFLNIFLAKAKELNRDVTNSDPGHWDEHSHFFYDVMKYPDANQAITIKSFVGIVPLLSCVIVKCSNNTKTRNFYNKLCNVSDNQFVTKLSAGKFLFTAVPVTKIRAVFKTLFSESEFLSPYGIRSLSKVYEAEPYRVNISGRDYVMKYVPGESDNVMFGGNSNWKGPIWLCMNYMIVELLGHLQEAFGDKFKVVYPSGKDVKRSPAFILKDISKRIVSLFLPKEDNARPLHGPYNVYARDPKWRPLVLFYEFFHAETGRGCGASHQTGWTSLVLEFLHKLHGTG